MGRHAIDLTDQTFGRLTAKERVRCKPSPKDGARWRCVCRCGNEIVTKAGHLRSGTTRSCGCLRRDRLKAANTKHGHTRLPVVEPVRPRYRLLRESKRTHPSPGL